MRVKKPGEAGLFWGSEEGYFNARQLPYSQRTISVSPFVHWKL